MRLQLFGDDIIALRICGPFVNLFCTAKYTHQTKYTNRIKQCALTIMIVFRLNLSKFQYIDTICQTHHFVQSNQRVSLSRIMKRAAEYSGVDDNGAPLKKHDDDIDARIATKWSLLNKPSLHFTQRSKLI
jgi:hypothetical protein